MREIVTVMGLAALVGCSVGRPYDGAHVNPRIEHAIDRGAVPSDEVFQLVIGVQLRNRSWLPSLLLQQSYTHDYYRPDEFGDTFGASAVDYQRLITWLTSRGLTIVRTTPSRTTVTVSGTTAQLEHAFTVEVHEFEDPIGIFRATREPFRFDPELAGLVTGTVGMNGTGRWRSHMARLSPAPNAMPPPGFKAPDIEKLYGADAIQNPGKGETVAILGTGNPPDPQHDVAKYMADSKPFNQTTINAGQYTQVFVGGPNRDPAMDAMKEQGENILDVEMVLAMAPQADVVHVLTATNTPGLFTDGISYIVNELPNAHAVSVSYGSCERGFESEAPVLNALFAQAKAEGQTWFFAAGDSGTDGCQDGAGNHVLVAGWPASSPFVIGVGGTQITGGKEVVWNDIGVAMSFDGSGGGGPSEMFDKPSWQEGLTPADGERDEPDVAALSGLPGLETTAGTVGGTSAATPIWAGAWALIDQAVQAKTGKPIATAQESLYALGRARLGFNDVVQGNLGGADGGATGGWQAGPGFDLATGWGTPNVAALIANWN
jgi:kumamolisin